MATEIEYRRTLKRVGQVRYQGVRSFACLDSEAMGFAASLYNQPWPDVIPGGGRCPCDQQEVIWHPDGQDDVCLVMAYYNTPGGKDIPLGFCKISLDMEPVERKVLSYVDPKDKQEKIMEGFDKPYAFMEWRHIKNPWRTCGRLKIRIDTAFAWETMPTVATTFAKLQGTINEVNLPNICELPAKSMMFVGAQMTHNLGGAVCPMTIHLLVADVKLDGTFQLFDDYTESECGLWLDRKSPLLAGKEQSGIYVRDKVWLGGWRWDKYDKNGPLSDAKLVEIDKYHPDFGNRKFPYRQDPWSSLKALKRWVK